MDKDSSHPNPPSDDLTTPSSDRLEVIDVWRGSRGTVCGTSLAQRIRNGLLRRASTLLLKRRLHSFGAGSFIEAPAWIRGGQSIAVGSGTKIWRSSRLNVVNPEKDRVVIEICDGVVVNPFVRIAGVTSIRIGVNAAIASNCFITDHDHYAPDISTSAVTNAQVIAAPTSIGDHAWLGEKVCVLKGVRIGEHSVIGAGSVVTRDIPAYSIAAGNPARVLRTWNHDTGEWTTPPAL